MQLWPERGLHSLPGQHLVNLVLNLLTNVKGALCPNPTNTCSGANYAESHLISEGLCMGTRVCVHRISVLVSPLRWAAPLSQQACSMILANHAVHSGTWCAALFEVWYLCIWVRGDLNRTCNNSDVCTCLYVCTNVQLEILVTNISLCPPILTTVYWRSVQT